MIMMFINSDYFEIPIFQPPAAFSLLVPTALRHALINLSNASMSAAAAERPGTARIAKPDRLWPHVVSGVTGRVTAEVFMSPINLLKVRLQHNISLKRRQNRVGKS